jgi:hypothetical protein
MSDNDYVIKGDDGQCSVIWQNGWMVLVLPDGTVIPKQTGINIKDNFHDAPLHSYDVTITVKINCH